MGGVGDEDPRMSDAIDLSTVQRIESGGRLGEFAAILERHQAGQARSLQRAIGPSEVGHPCDRHLAYKLAGIPPSTAEGLKWAALLGTWCHSGAEQAMREENERLGVERYLVERRAIIADAIVEGGNTDVFDVELSEVIDWKFPGEASSAKSAKTNPVEYVVQGMLYGLGWHRMGYTVKTVRIVFFPRWSNRIEDAHEWVAAWSETVALQALDRLAIVKAESNIAVAGLARWTDIAADTSKCMFCPWLRRRDPSEVQADETGCHGHYQSNDWMGLQTVAMQRIEDASALFSAIEGAGSTEELGMLWRDYRPIWTDKHTEAARERKAEILTKAGNHGK